MGIINNNYRLTIVNGGYVFSIFFYVLTNRLEKKSRTYPNHFWCIEYCSISGITPPHMINLYVFIISFMSYIRFYPHDGAPVS